MWAIPAGALSGVFGFYMGWFTHRMYVNSMWRIERAARHRAQGRK